MTQLFWLLTSFTCCMFALVAHRIFKIIYSCSLLGVIFSQPCFLPFPSNVVSHIFVVFFSLHSLQSPSTLILPDHAFVSLLSLVNSTLPITAIFHLCPPCIPSLLLCLFTYPCLSLSFIFLPLSPLLEFFRLLLPNEF